MECLTINEIFKDLITKLNNSLLPPHFIGDTGSIRRMQEFVKRVLDELGEMSAHEQKLDRIITTAEKLRTADGHTLYVIKDATANSGAGEAVGLLRVGKKHLFIYDEGQTVHEVEPLCVLDFFVKRSHQRHGWGRKLFDHMLTDQQTSAERLAVDGPSMTMKAFMAKNYHVTRLIKQPNNFAVSPQFFEDLPAATKTWKRQKDILSDDRGIGQSQRPAQNALPFAAGSPAGRFTARHPPSTMNEVLHGNTVVRSPDQHREKYQLASNEAPTPAPSPPGAGAQAAPGLASGGDGDAGEPQRPSSLAVGPAPPAAHSPAPATPAGTPSRRDSQLTEKGFFDVKFYHKKLW